MIGFLWRRVHETAKENRRLEQANTKLLLALRQANDSTEKAMARCRRLASDNQMLACMVRDRKVAESFLEMAREIDRLPG